MNQGYFITRSSSLKSHTGYHHIMLKGINPSNLFESDQDKVFFLHSIPNFLKSSRLTLLLKYTTVVFVVFVKE